MLDKSRYYWAVLVILLGGVALIDACRPKGGEDVEPIDSTALSSCILLNEKVNGILLRTYEFDSTRRLERMVEYAGIEPNNRIIKRYTFEYTSKTRLVRIRETNLAVKDNSFIYELDYDRDSKLKTIRPFRVYNSGPKLEDSLKITYGTNNRISEIKSRTGLTSKWEYDTAANVKKWFIRKPLSQTDSLVAEYGSYDDKVNIYAFAEGMQLVNLLNGRPHSRRNPLTYVTEGQSVEVSYQYNTKRVPTQVVMKFKSSDNTLRETVFLYELNCK